MDIKKKTYKNINYYLDLPWTYTVETVGSGKNKYYVFSVNELPGIATDGKTFDEAMEGIKEAIEGAVSLYMQNNEEIPVPIDESQYKGNISYRTSSKRHYLIAKEAQKIGKSLSQFIDECIDTNIKK